MSTDPVSSVTSSGSTAPATETSGTTAAPSQVNGSTKVSSVTDLKEKAPKVYDAMLMSIAQFITNEMYHHQEELKKLMREGRQNG